MTPIGLAGDPFSGARALTAPMMTCVAGRLWQTDGSFREGWLLHDGKIIVDSGEGRAPQPPVSVGDIIPAFVDAHTHVGDRALRGAVDLQGRSLAEVVAPPDGLKHRLLRETPGDRLLLGMRDALAELASGGAAWCADFREQGVPGVAQLRRASEGMPTRPLVFGRCAGDWSDEEAAAVLRDADGIGLSGLGDVKGDVPERAAAAARAAGKRFALHLSEAEREDMPRALALKPDFLVHGVAATKEDLRAAADARVPIVVCPRSNALFGRVPPVSNMLAAGVTVALGSDNAMFHPLGALREAELLSSMLPREALLQMLVVNGRRALKLPEPTLARGWPAAFVVLQGWRAAHAHIPAPS